MHITAERATLVLACTTATAYTDPDSDAAVSIQRQAQGALQALPGAAQIHRLPNVPDIQAVQQCVLFTQLHTTTLQ